MDWNGTTNHSARGSARRVESDGVYVRSQTALSYTIRCRVSNAVSYTIRCRESYLGRGDLLKFRVRTALGNSAMQGLTHDEAHEAPTFVQDSRRGLLSSLSFRVRTGRGEPRIGVHAARPLRCHAGSPAGRWVESGSTTSHGKHTCGGGARRRAARREDDNYDYLYDVDDPDGDGSDVLADGYGALAEVRSNVQTSRNASRVTYQ